MRWVSLSANQNLRSSSISTNQNFSPIIFSAENISNKMGENESSWWLKLFKDNFKNARATFWSNPDCNSIHYGWSTRSCHIILIHRWCSSIFRWTKSGSILKRVFEMAKFTWKSVDLRLWNKKCSGWSRKWPRYSYPTKKVRFNLFA